MTNRERAMNILHFRQADRLPAVHFGYWKELLFEWAQQGKIPAEIAEKQGDGNEYDRKLDGILGFDFNWCRTYGADMGLRPPFETKVLEELPDGSRRVRNSFGIVEKIHPGVVSIPAEDDYLLKDRKAFEQLYREKMQYTEERINKAFFEKFNESVYEKTDIPIGINLGSLMGDIRNMVSVVGMIGFVGLVGPDGRVHSVFKQTETRTGRISSAEPNLQNIPVRTEIGSVFRRFFYAPDGETLVDADYSQIELRVLAHIAADEQMIEAFRTGADIHTRTASQVFGLPPEFVTPRMRSRAKAVNFGIVYGIGAYSLSKDIGVSVAEANDYIDSYLSTFHGVRQYMEATKAFAKEHGYVGTLFGRRRELPELTASNRATRSFGERVAMNTPIQGTAADIIKIAMVRVYRRLKAEGLSARLILQVHDELIVEAPEAERERVAALLREEMSGAAELSVPLVVDVGCGRTWYEAK